MLFQQLADGLDLFIDGEFDDSHHWPGADELGQRRVPQSPYQR